MNIKDALQERADMWAGMGHPAIMERFVLRNGTFRKGQELPRLFKRGVMKECFSNAARIAVFDSFHTPTFGYEEGYAWRPKSLAFLVHHAWNTDPKGKVIDTTWDDPKECEYMGVDIPFKEHRAELAKNKVYGVLDPGMINVDYIFARDPGLKDVVEEIIGRKWK